MLSRIQNEITHHLPAVRQTLSRLVRDAQQYARLRADYREDEIDQDVDDEADIKTDALSRHLEPVCRAVAKKFPAADVAWIRALVADEIENLVLEVTDGKM